MNQSTSRPASNQPANRPSVSGELMTREGESLAIGLTRAEVDQQIATAKAYPRQVSAVQRYVLELATLDEETAAEMIYERPQAGEVIRGPSIRFAELLLQAWGNARCGSRTVHVDQSFVESEGVYHDLETNTAITQRVRRRIIKRDGGRYAEDQILVTANAGGSIARRNAILAGIPKPIWRPTIAAVEALLKGKIETLAARRAALLNYAATAMQVDKARIFKSMGLGGEADIGLDELMSIRVRLEALKNKDGSLDELFPLPSVAPAKQDTAARLAPKADAPKADGPAAGFSAGHVESETRQEPAEGEQAQDETPHDPETGEVAEQQTAGERMTAQMENPPEGFVHVKGGDDDPLTKAEKGADAPKPKRAAAKKTPEPADPALATQSGGAGEAQAENPAPPPAEADPAPVGDITTFWTSVNAATDWEGARKAVVTLAQSDDGKALTDEDYASLRARLWAVVKERGWAIDPALNPTAFRIWMEWETDPDALLGTYRVLANEAAHANMKPDAQARLKKVLEERVVAMGGTV